MIESILLLFLPTVEVILVSLGLLITAVGAKIGSGIYLNVFTLAIKFDWKRLLEGVVKGLIFTLSVLAFSLVASGVPIVLSVTGIILADGAVAISYTASIGVILVATYAYLKSAWENYVKTLNITPEEIKALIKEDEALG